jgi:hypothetical protein
MPVRGGELTQSLDQHYFEERGADRSRFGRVFGCIDGVEAREPLPSGTQCVRFCTNGGDATRTERVTAMRGSYEAPVRTVAKPCESGGTPD